MAATDAVAAAARRGRRIVRRRRAARPSRGGRSALAAQPLERRPRGGLRIRRFSDALAPDFHRINAQWIEDMYRLEPTDIDVLENPRARIIEPGGDILFVEDPELGIVGTCALQKTGERQFELTKMGVLPKRAGARRASSCSPR